MNVSLGALAKTKWYEYLVRFAFGGAITVTAGILAKHFGPVFGGLFLAFPAIFPASATLVAKHETRKKQNAGIATSSRGRQAAAVDAAGATLARNKFPHPEILTDRDEPCREECQAACRYRHS